MSLFTEHPLPWRLKKYSDGGWDILDSKDGEVMYCASFTGDGATIQLDEAEAAELIAVINSQPRP